MASSSTEFSLQLPSLTEAQAPHSSIEDYKKLGKLGEGGCAIVFKAFHKRTGTEVAVKKVLMTDDNSHIAGELRILQGTMHENIVKLHDFIWSKTNFYFVLEFANGGTLLERCPLPDSDARMFFRQIVSGLAYLHDLDVAHLDIKPDNILIHEVGRLQVARITDFGVSQMPGGVVHRHEGTSEYMPPEGHLEQVFNGFQADLWSLGVTLYEMLTGCKPFHGIHAEDSYGLEQSILNVNYSMPSFLRTHAQCLIQKLIQLKPCDRHSLARLMIEDDWLQRDTTTNAK